MKNHEIQNKENAVVKFIICAAIIAIIAILTFFAEGSFFSGNSNATLDPVNGINIIASIQS